MGSDDLGDPSDPLYARFKTWRHVIGNLIEYFEYIESMEKSQSKEYAKLSKTLEVPFKTPEFAPDGIATIWQGMRDKAVQLSTFHTEQATSLKSGVIADLTRLRSDIKKHLTDLDKEGRGGSKKVGKRLDKFSDTTQALGKWIPVAETNHKSLDAGHDPYVLWRQTRHKLYRVVDEENMLNEQLLGLQSRCQHYETLILQAVQKAIRDHGDQVTRESQYNTTIVNELNTIAMGIPLDKEWTSFAQREPTLLKLDHKPRDPATADFPFSDHSLTKPLLEAHLARKSTMLKRRSTSYYVLSPSGFLHEYKDADPVLNPDPTLSLKLSECELGNAPSRSGKAGFTIRGKDAGKSFGGMSHEYIFRTDNMEQATSWWTHLEKFIGNAPRTDAPVSPATDSEPESSPIEKDHAKPAPVATTQTARQTAEPATAPTTAAPTTTAAPVTTAAPTTTATTANHTTAAPTTAPSHAQAAATAATTH